MRRLAACDDRVGRDVGTRAATPYAAALTPSNESDGTVDSAEHGGDEHDRGEQHDERGHHRVASVLVPLHRARMLSHASEVVKGKMHRPTIMRGCNPRRRVVHLTLRANFVAHGHASGGGAATAAKRMPGENLVRPPNRRQ